jgi:hypothetical protein
VTQLAASSVHYSLEFLIQVVSYNLFSALFLVIFGAERKTARPLERGEDEYASPHSLRARELFATALAQAMRSEVGFVKTLGKLTGTEFY